MRNAARILTIALGAAAIVGCHKAQPAANDQDIAIEDNLAASGLPANAEVETLPPDESSVDSNGELVKGDDNPDVNNLGNGD